MEGAWNDGFARAVADVALRQVFDGIAYVAPDGGVLRVRYVNAAFEQMFRWSGAEIRGQPIDVLFPSGKRERGRGLSQVARRGAARLVARDGTEVLVDMEYHPIAIDGIDGALLVMRDVTEKRRLEQIASASVVSENVGYFFAGIRHELGNPINSLKAALTLLVDPMVELPEHRRADYLRRALGEVSRMEGLLEQLRTFNTNEAVRPERIGIRAFLERFARIAGEDCARRGASLAVDAPEDVHVVSDARLVQQILLLLLANALDALDAAPIKKVSLVASRSARGVDLALCDTGPGLTPEQLENAQRPFVTTKPKGTGLGLPLAHRYATLIGCQLSLDSEPGVGTRCTLQFDSLDSSER